MGRRSTIGRHDEPGWDYGFWKSAFFEIAEGLGARYGAYNRRLVPLTFGNDRFADYWALRRQVAMYDVSGERPLDIVGPDAERLLDRLMTRDMTRLKPGRATYGLLCNAGGGLLCDGILLRLTPERFSYVHADGEVLPWLLAHADGLDVEVRDPGASVLQVQGPRSLDVLAAACDEPVELAYFDVAEAHMAGQPVVLSRTGWTGELGFEIYLWPENTDGSALWRHVAAAGEAFGLAQGALDSMDIRRIEAGILNYGSDMDASLNPFQVGLGGFVDMAKGDFIGKAALAAADRVPRLYGLKCDPAEPAIGGAVSAANQVIGRVTAAAWSPFLGHGTAIVRLEDAPPVVGELVVVGRDGESYPASLIELPFYDDEKCIPRGLDTTIPDQTPNFSK
jgi:aminomethyltransferase